jgi:NADP-dependent 3-hydroxy acid dehydrogenase YdfG
MSSFADKVVVITGASSGIGAAAAVHFMKHGAKITITGRNEDNLLETKAKCINEVLQHSEGIVTLKKAKTGKDEENDYFEESKSFKTYREF